MFKNKALYLLGEPFDVFLDTVLWCGGWGQRQQNVGNYGNWVMGACVPSTWDRYMGGTSLFISLFI